MSDFQQILFTFLRHISVINSRHLNQRRFDGLNSIYEYMHYRLIQSMLYNKYQTTQTTSMNQSYDSDHWTFSNQDDYSQTRQQMSFEVFYEEESNPLFGSFDKENSSESQSLTATPGSQENIKLQTEGSCVRTSDYSIAEKLRFDALSEMSRKTNDSKEVYLSKAKISKKEKKPDYKKNICGYMTKKIVKTAFDKEFRPVIGFLCDVWGVSSFEFGKMYNKFESITGPTHLYAMLTPKTAQISPEEIKAEIGCKRVFRAYFIWFLRFRYLRYLLSEGKMEQKDVYIKYKNKELMYLMHQESKAVESDIQKVIQDLNKKFQNQGLPSIQTAAQVAQKEQQIYNRLNKQYVSMHAPASSILSKMPKDRKKHSMQIEPVGREDQSQNDRASIDNFFSFDGMCPEINCDDMAV